MAPLGQPKGPMGPFFYLEISACKKDLKRVIRTNFSINNLTEKPWYTKV